MINKTAILGIKKIELLKKCLLIFEIFKKIIKSYAFQSEFPYLLQQKKKNCI